MRAKLAIGDTWYKEGGSAALTQAESEYKDFITFFPNTPEAAEAQMKVGDIYFEQMYKPDRDPANAVHAQEEYRTMLQDFPDSPLIPRAKQRLREVQEVLAQRQFEIGEFYAQREVWPASIARLQTVADTYPLFSHSDQTLITLGDAYATEAQFFSHLKLPPAQLAEMVKIYNDRAAAAWERVVVRYPMAPHVEDAKDRLIAMGRDVPEPTAQELAESEAEEGSRINVKLKERAMLLVKTGPSTIQAARVGEPTLSDPPQTIAPDIDRENKAMYEAALKGQPLPGVSPNGTDATTTAITNGTAPPTPASNQPAAAPLQVETIPDQGGSNGSTVTVEVPSSNGDSSSSDSGASSGISGTAVSTGAPSAGLTSSAGTPVGGPPANPATASSPVVKPVGPVENKALPPIDKPAEAPTRSTT